MGFERGLMQERLQKILSRAGVASRRHAEEMIVAGQVKLNGKIVRELGTKADPAVDKITVNNQPISFSATVVYALNKPLDVVSTSRDPQQRKTVMDLVPEEPRVYPIGRLDRMTGGLLLLTNDGDLALKLSHPRYEHTKEYVITGTGHRAVTDLLGRMRHGVVLQDGPFVPDKVDYIGQRKDQLVFRVVVHEGRNHLLRRFCERIGIEITSLVRTRVGPITLSDLMPGSWRKLTEAELSLLRASVQSAQPGLPGGPASGSVDQLLPPQPAQLAKPQPLLKRAGHRPAN